MTESNERTNAMESPAEEQLKLFKDKTSISIEDLKMVIRDWNVVDKDFSQEIEVQSLREKAVLISRKNRELEKTLDEIDLEIGSLVRNCQLTCNRKCLKNKPKIRENVGKTGINAFSKEGRERLEAYQSLFYVLQTQPKYLARLLVHVNHGMLSNFRRSCMQTMFGDCIGDREDYCIIRFFLKSIDEEVQSNVHEKTDIDVQNGKPVMLQVAIDYYRSRCLSQMGDLLRPHVLRITRDENLNLTTDPVKVYRRWIQENRSHSDILKPLTVTVEEAMCYEQVKDKLSENIATIVSMANQFLETICSEEFTQVIPYGMRFLARHLWEVLSQKFTLTKRELLKVTASVLLNEFICPLIDLPDLYQVVQPRTAGASVQYEARTVLSTIRKLLKDASHGKQSFSFGPNSQDSNDFYSSLGVVLFLQAGHKRIVQFLRDMFDITSPEVNYSMHSLSDELLVTPPELYITLEDIMEVHTWMHKFRSVVAPNSSDPMNSLIDACGAPPTKASEIIYLGTDYETYSRKHMNENIRQIVVLLTLRDKTCSTLKFSATSKTPILVRQAIIDLIKYRQDCHDFNDLLFKDISRKEKDMHERTKGDIDEQNSPKSTTAVIPFNRSLSSLIEFVKLNLKSVQCNSFADLGKQMLDDLTERVASREQRLFDSELLLQVINGLLSKRIYLKETIKSRKEYLHSCLSKFEAPATNSPNKDKIPQTIRYTAKQLKDKGILVSFDGVDANHWKQTIFIISPLAEKAAKFSVQVKYLGVELFKSELELSHLLRLQYESVPSIKLSNKAQVKLAPLIRLINKKFFVRK
ncbi:Ras GTPase-activating-like protein IQGAP1 [Halotydeus destructor]|nr:Ras GTPase-activating-like protein IQGAP1 [Halotydeus destructor]